MESIIEIIIGFVPANWQGVVLSVIALASAVASVTPTPKEGTVWSTVYKFIIDLPALNIGKAKETGE